MSEDDGVIFYGNSRVVDSLGNIIGKTVDAGVTWGGIPVGANKLIPDDTILAVNPRGLELHAQFKLSWREYADAFGDIGEASRHAFSAMLQFRSAMDRKIPMWQHNREVAEELFSQLQSGRKHGFRAALRMLRLIVLSHYQEASGRGGTVSTSRAISIITGVTA